MSFLVFTSSTPLAVAAACNLRKAPITSGSSLSSVSKAFFNSGFIDNPSKKKDHQANWP